MKDSVSQSSCTTLIWDTLDLILTHLDKTNNPILTVICISVTWATTRSPCCHPLFSPTWAGWPHWLSHTTSYSVSRKMHLVVSRTWGSCLCMEMISLLFRKELLQTPQPSPICKYTYLIISYIQGVCLLWKILF